MQFPCPPTAANANRKRALFLVTLEEMFAMVMVLLIVFLLVLILGVLYGLVLRGASREGTAWRAVAQTGFWAGIIAAFLGIPAAIAGIGCGAVGLKSDARSQALAGLVLSAACIAAWTVMEIVAG
jgi:hypothetical protein